MRSLMLALGACLVALNFAGCSSTGSCGSGKGLLCGGLFAGKTSCGQASCSGGCGETSCSGGCGDTACSGGLATKNYGGKTGLGLGLMEAGPDCKATGCSDAGCDGGCQSKKCPLRQLQLGSRLKQRLASHKGCGSSDCGCEAPALPESDCGCSACSESAAVSAPAPAPVVAPVDSSAGCGCEVAAEHEVVTEESDVQLVSHDDRGGLLGKFGFGRKHQVRGCGVQGCGGAAGLCPSCLSRHRPGAGLGAGRGLGAGAGTIPHRDPSIHAGGASAGPAGQIPTYAYPYYTTRAPRDFLDPNPPTIGY